jgi:hypothetical protein
MYVKAYTNSCRLPAGFLIYTTTQDLPYHVIYFLKKRLQKVVYLFLFLTQNLHNSYISPYLLIQGIIFLFYQHNGMKNVPPSAINLFLK